ncbi:MAG: isoprenylcysteine carboxylmethyltransferase family protein [Candidatus Thorarchaeota archaeon]
MEANLIFRLSFIALWILFIIARGIPSRNVPTVRRPRSERWAALKQEGRLAIVALFFSVYGTSIMGLLYLIDVPWIWWSYIFLPIEIRVVGLILAIANLPFTYWVGKTLADSFSYTLEVQDDQKLVTSGPYSRVRHPLYLVTFWFFVSQILISDNWIFIVILIIILPYLFQRMGKEEQMMVDEFGEEYISYMNRTGRLFPRIRRPKDL